MALGEEVGRLVRPGQVVALTGPLGAGKTVFVKGMARALGLDPATVTSPTYTFVHRYDDARKASRTRSAMDGGGGCTEYKGPMFHVDLFRADSDRELASIGFDEILNAGALVVVEWSEKAERMLPAEAVRVKIEYDRGGRRIRIENLPP